MTNDPKTISLVLGSGGARGMAHVGIIRWLEERNYKIKSISGCSIGSLIGGAYATDTLDDFVTWIEKFTKADIYGMLDFVLGSEGLVKGDKVMDALKEIIGTTNIEDLALKYTAVAADIANEKEIWMQTGPINEAIRASISLPIFFNPYELKGVKLIDGGILNPTPIEPTLEDGTDFTIAVNLGGLAEQKLPDEEPSKEKIEEEKKEKADWQKKLDYYLNVMKNFTSKSSNQWNMVYVADQSFNTMQNAIANQKMSLNPPDYLINIPRNRCETLEFDRSAEMIEYGYQKASEALGDLDLTP